MWGHQAAGQRQISVIHHDEVAGARRGRDDPQIVGEPHGIVDGSGGEHAAILLGDLGKAARHATSAAIDAAPHTPGHARLPSAVIAGQACPTATPARIARGGRR